MAIDFWNRFKTLLKQTLRKQNNEHLKRDYEIFANLAPFLIDPENYKEILEIDDKGTWIIVTNNELESMIVNDVWDILVNKGGKKLSHWFQVGF